MGSSSAPRSWLPHLAGGASVWRLADDLNAPSLMGGRLLVPQVVGPSELPEEVRWNHSALVPLGEALERWPEEVRRGVREFLACLERVEQLFEEDGYEDFEHAFTLPAFGLEGGAHYFWHPDERKVVVQNWGACPRDHRGRELVVFDRIRWGQLRRGAEQLAGLSPPTSTGEVAPGERLSPHRSWPRRLLGVAMLAAATSMLGYLASDEAPPFEAPPASAPAPPAPSPVPAPTTEAPAPPIPRPHQTISFALGRETFDDSQRASLEAIRGYLHDHPEVTRLRIEGHADYLGLEHENQPLSRNRARRVAQWLIDHGIDAERLVPVGCSERYPLDRGSSAEARRRNRRVEFFVLEPAGVEGPPPHPRCDP